MNTVSVIIATYRRDDTLKRAILSVLNQSYKNVEIIVVDDNADQHWNDVVYSIVNNFPNCIYICNSENKGSAETRNIGLRNASGEYITFLDDDDVYLENKVKNQYEFMSDNSLDYCITDIDLYYEDGSLCEHRTRSYIQETDKKSMLKYHFMHHIAGTDTMMFKKDYLLKIGGFGTIDFGEDFYLFQKAIEGEGKFGYLPVSDIIAFVHTGETGMSIGQGKIDGENQVYNYIKEYFNIFDFKDKQYIKMRHFAVLAFAYLRQKSLVKFFVAGTKSFFCSPFSCLKLLIAQRKKPCETEKINVLALLDEIENKRKQFVEI